ncbi:hypothetical protein TRVL_09511 [Trypanosoma vivax]|nr:hypothetical protein TRVL_09511 [Trypanosoma vivax]
MVPTLNMKNVSDTYGRGSEYLPGNTMDRTRRATEAGGRTPLRSRRSPKNTSRGIAGFTYNGAVNRGGLTDVDNVVDDPDLCQRAAVVTPILGVNILHVRDVHLLQRKAIELAERFSSLEEWYKTQLRERSAYLEHHVTHLAAAACQTTHSSPDRALVPTAIRCRQAVANKVTGPCRPALSLCSVSSSNEAGVRGAGGAYSSALKTSKSPNNACLSSFVRPSTPVFTRPRHSPTRDSVAKSHTSSPSTMQARRNDKESSNTAGNTGRVRTASSVKVGHRARSPSLLDGRVSGRSSDRLSDEPSNNVTKSASKPRNRRSSLFLCVSSGKQTPSRLHPSSNRARRAPDAQVHHL